MILQILNSNVHFDEDATLNDQTPIKYFKGELKHVLQKGIDSSLYS
jgi:hypothetical protein